jgi:hypothetical protein
MLIEVRGQKVALIAAKGKVINHAKKPSTTLDFLLLI